MRRDELMREVARALFAAFEQQGRADELLRRLESGLREQCSCGEWKTDDDLETCAACEEKRRAEFIATLPPADPLLGIVPLDAGADAVALLASRPERFVTFLTGPSEAQTYCRLCSLRVVPAADGPEALRHALISHNCPRTP